jgi:hypothetical protein
MLAGMIAVIQGLMLVNAAPPLPRTVQRRVPPPSAS